MIMFLPGWLVGREFLTQEAGRNISSVTLYFLIVVILLIIFGEQINRLAIAGVNKLMAILDHIKKEKQSEESED